MSFRRIPDDLQSFLNRRSGPCQKGTAGSVISDVPDQPPCIDTVYSRNILFFQLMEEQGYITADEHQAAVKPLSDFIEPGSWNYIFSIRDAVLNFRFRGDGIMFCGHTHHAAVWELTDKGMVRPRLERRFSSPALRNETSTIRIRAGSRYIINVGSVGYPRNDRCVSYAIYDDEAKSVSMRRLSFDFKGYVAKMLDRGIRLPRWLFLPPAFA